MTAGLSAMNGLYGSTYGMQNYYNNPYFLQAYNYPNYNQMYAQQQVPVQQVPATSTVNSQNPSQLTNSSNINFQGAQNVITNEAKEEKKGNGLAWALGIGATAIGASWWLASRGKARNATGLWNQIKTGFTSLFDKSADVAKTISFQEINGKKVFSIPEKTRVLKQTEAVVQNEALGLALKDGLKWTDDAAKVAGYKFDLKDGDDIIRVAVRNNNGTNNFTYTNISKGLKDEGRKLTSVSESLQKQIDEVVNAVNKKDIKAVPSGIELKSMFYGLENNSGTSSLYFDKLGAKSKIDTGLKFVKSDRFLDGSDAVNAVMHDNETFKQAYQNLTGKKVSYEGWNIAQANYNPAGFKNKTGNVWPSDTHLIISNNEIIGLVENGKALDVNTDRFKSLKEQFGDVFEKAMDNQKDFTNVIRTLA